jgi:hypothetical protein
MGLSFTIAAGPRQGSHSQDRVSRDSCPHLTVSDSRFSKSAGRAVGQEVSRWLPTAAARVRSKVWSSRICGGQSGAGAGFI